MTSDLLVVLMLAPSLLVLALNIADGLCILHDRRAATTRARGKG